MVEELFDRREGRRVLSVEQCCGLEPQNCVDYLSTLMEWYVVKEDNNLFSLRFGIASQAVQHSVDKVFEYDSIGASFDYLEPSHFVLSDSGSDRERIVYWVAGVVSSTEFLCRAYRLLRE